MGKLNPDKYMACVFRGHHPSERCGEDCVFHLPPKKVAELVEAIKKDAERLSKKLYGN